MYAASIGVVKNLSVNTNAPLGMHLRKDKTTLSPNPQIDIHTSVSPKNLLVYGI